MKQTQEIKSFLYSQYFADGLRIAFGALVPALLFSYIGDIKIGTVVSLGAIITSIVDTPGPTKDRRNAMLVLVGSIFLISFITKTINQYEPATVFLLSILCFSMCMIAVYGARAAALGTASILVMILNIDDLKMGADTPLAHAFLITVGAAWYMLLSLTLTQFRPFRLSQQALAESIQNTATYLRLKANFYDLKIDSEKNYQKLIDQQVIIHQHQDTVRELLFKSKAIVKDTTQIGRLLVVIFTDMVDVFEKIMATHYDYQAIRKNFNNTHALRIIKLTLNRIANEMDNLAYHINANKRPQQLYNFKSNIENIKTAIDQIEAHGKNAVVLKKVLINIRDLTDKIENIYQHFTTKERLLDKNDETDLSKFLSHQSFNPKILKDNISLGSGTFRHALRMVIVMLIAYGLSKFIPFGNHSYWILMTVLVILKPGFSLTKQRNYQRMVGTIIGGVAGVGVLLIVEEEVARFAFLMVFMVLAYSFIRRNYILGVMFLTPYLLILYSFLGIGTIQILQERVVDTVIGSLLAFSSSYIIFPSWESKNIQSTMRKLLIANYNYLVKALEYMAGITITQTEYKLVRKDVYVCMANMTSTFQRMITEPKSKQKNANDLNKFLIYNHILSSYSVALVNVVINADEESIIHEHIKLLKSVLLQLARTIKQFKPSETDDPFIEIDVLAKLTINENEITNEETKLITEQVLFIKKITQDLNKVCEKMELLKVDSPNS
ncbi:FUSC family protein [Olivibacter sp. SDN3]|uniref:FUSC family protein n=1 Tax=Olivibacter sp. SDN3 TaxID=2764720 RepID=UPI00165136FD|nr:FUSC family membrane protein [Olivibacter sp. SDN3]QNL48446.1 FUSC family protein [Olivibacter sp. SDN3]